MYGRVYNKLIKKKKAYVGLKCMKQKHKGDEGENERILLQGSNITYEVA